MSGRRVLFLASGALSHDLDAWIERSPDPLYGEFDRSVLDHLAGGTGMELLEMEQTLIDRAKPEGAFRDLFMLLGVMGCGAKGQMMAYESLPGVGMGVIFFDRAVYREKGGDGMLNEVQRE
jgi:aromatic ring-opening dioxygenase catalytic subunit (LigB family)